MYLYGWPVQKLLSWYWSDMTPWVLFMCTLLVCAALAAVSWRLIEEPALRLKPRTPRRAKLKTEAGLGESQGA
jgi:peptidoglycan/LPS O-acetylase OafA/YrhL